MDDVLFCPERDGLRRPSRQESHSNLETIVLIAVIILSQVRTFQHHSLYGILGPRFIRIVSYPLKLNGSECRHIYQSAITIFYECSRYFLSVMFLSNLHQIRHESDDVWLCLWLYLGQEKRNNQTSTSTEYYLLRTLSSRMIRALKSIVQIEVSSIPVSESKLSTF